MNAVTSTLGKPSKPGAFNWLIKREFWENRGGFFWAPVITGTRPSSASRLHRAA